MKISTTINSSLSENESIDFIYKKVSKNNAWQCMYKYSNSTNGQLFSISSDWFIKKDEYSAVLYTEKQAEKNIKQILQNKRKSYHQKLFDDIWNKYLDSHQQKMF